jgi:hypothetical protein
LAASSVSKKQLILEIKGKAKILCDLKRHLSPKTVGIIMRSLPLEGHAHFLGENITYFESAIDSGTERARKEFQEGDIAFLSSAGCICFFMENSSPGKIMTPIGKITQNIEALRNVKNGDVLCLYEDTV